MAFSIDSEGIDVAKWLAGRGATAFVLKYRVAHTGEDATQEFMTLFQDKQKFNAIMAKVVPLSLADGLAALTYVRRHASNWGISADKGGHRRILSRWNSRGRGWTSLFFGRPTRLRRADLPGSLHVQERSYTRRRSTDVSCRRHGRSARSRNGQHRLIHSVDSCPQIRRAAHVRQGWSWFRDEETELSIGPLDRQLWRLARIPRAAKKSSASQTRTVGPWSQ